MSHFETSFWIQFAFIACATSTFGYMLGRVLDILSQERE